MKILYKTNNIDLVRKLSYREDKEYFELYFNRDNVNKVIELIGELDDFVIVLIGINKSNVSDSLLIALENLDKGTFIGTTEDTLKPALLSRFDAVREIQSADYSEIINSFFEKQHIQQHFRQDIRSIYFFKALAKHTTNNDNIWLINDICTDILRCTNNIFWDYYIDRLERKWSWC